MADPASIASAVIDGVSFAGTSIEQISNAIQTGRNVCIQIANCSEKCYLTHPRVYTYSGYSLDPPQPTIKKNTKEVCSFSKVASTACGAVGVLTYEIHKQGSKTNRVGDLAIMFSVPYNYNSYENMFALGISEAKLSCDYNLYYKMYYEEGLFERSNATGSDLEYSRHGLVIKGTMSPAGRSIMKVELWDED